jgi:hypothetical protein
MEAIAPASSHWIVYASISTTSLAAEPAGPCTRSPLTKVPWRERSMTVTPPSPTRICAWLRDTPLLARTMSLGASCCVALAADADHRLVEAQRC